MTCWQIQIHVVLTKNHASSECCSQITIIIIHTQKRNRTKNQQGEKSFNGIYGLQSITDSKNSNRERWHSSIHPSSCTHNYICNLTWACALPAQLLRFSYVQLPASLNRVSLCKHRFPPKRKISPDLLIYK